MKRKYFTIRYWPRPLASRASTHSWAVFRKGQSGPVISECTRDEANHHADALEKALIICLIGNKWRVHLDPPLFGDKDHL